METCALEEIKLVKGHKIHGKNINIRELEFRTVKLDEYQTDDSDRLYLNDTPIIIRKIINEKGDWVDVECVGVYIQNGILVLVAK